MILLKLLHIASMAKGGDYSECIPGATELGLIALKNTPYFSNSPFTSLQMSILSNDTDTAYGFLWEMANSNDLMGRISKRDHQGMTLLHWAAFEGNVDIVKSLLCFDADANAVDKEGNTPLHLAALSQSPASVKMLMATKGTNINAKNNIGSTPLHLAIKNGVFSVVLTLLAQRVQTDIEDNRGRVALEAAIAGGNEAIIKLLKAAGATAKTEEKPALYQWTDERGGLNPVEGGRDGYCLEKVYVGRVHHEGNIIPAKVCPLASQAYAAYNGTELILKKYEILDSEHIAWEPMNEEKKIPSDAFVGGITKNGEKLYVGRANIIADGIPYLTPGKVNPSDKLLKATYGYKEYTFKTYEILIIH